LVLLDGRDDSVGSDRVLRGDEMLGTDGVLGADGVLGPDEVRALCDRHRGFGADGLIVGRTGRGGADLEMILSNADGSLAEISGNGIRCLVQAAEGAGMVGAGAVSVDTGGGRRMVDFRDLGDGLGLAEVDMGPARLGDELPLDREPVSLTPPLTVRRARTVEVGNPHVVLLAGDGTFDLEMVGPQIERSRPGGANVELVRSFERRQDGSSALEIEVWERGVGITSSCGTGACAAAAASFEWGLVSHQVEVRTSGGSLRVRVGEASVTLSGPTRLVGEVVVDLTLLRGLVSELRPRGAVDQDHGAGGLGGEVVKAL